MRATPRSPREEGKVRGSRGQYKRTFEQKVMRVTLKIAWMSGGKSIWALRGRSRQHAPLPDWPEHAWGKSADGTGRRWAKDEMHYTETETLA